MPLKFLRDKNDLHTEGRYICRSATADDAVNDALRREDAGATWPTCSFYNNNNNNNNNNNYNNNLIIIIIIIIIIITIF